MGMRPGSGTKARGVVLAAAALLLTAAAADAQRRPSDRTRVERRDGAQPSWFFGVNLVGAEAVGEFDEAVDRGFGLDLSAAVPVLADGAFRLRVEGGFLIYGHESFSECFPLPVGCRVGVDVTTTNNIFGLGIGPELTVPRGVLQPYLNALGGFSYFATTSSLSGVDDGHAFANTRNHSDLVPAVKLGGGLRARLSRGSTPVHLDMGVQYHLNGVAEYLSEGDIVDEPDGSIMIFPNRTEANLLAFRIGVSVGVGGGGDDRGRRGRRR